MIPKKLPFILFAAGTVLFCNQAKSQLYINSATFFIQPGATVTVQGNVTSNTSIQGTGTVLLSGSSNQTVDMSGDSIQNLQINNTSNATLLSNLIIGNSLTFTNGKITLGTNNLYLASTATTSGGGTGNFIETNSTGQAIQAVATNLSSFAVPVGLGTTYRPVFLTTTGTYSASANVGVRVATAGDPNRPPMISDYLLAYWPVTQTGITGTLNVAGQYNGTPDISGSQANLKGYFFNGTDWSSANGTSTTASNQIATNVTTASGDVYGMDGFILLKTKVFLQGAYNTTTGAMSYGLMTQGLIPLSDPYRMAPYSTNFSQVADAIPETTTSSVLSAQLNTANNIVDWIFIELRDTTASPGNTVLQTRSALLQSNGNIVDVDGVSPVTFNNVTNRNYRIAIRHRNHIGICLNNTNPVSLSETKSTASTLDLTSNSSQLYAGTVNNAPIATVVGGVYAMYGGNSNSDLYTKKTGTAAVNDYTLLLANLNSTLSYSSEDFNMDGYVKKTGTASTNDYTVFLSILGGVSATTTIITQPTF